MWFSKKCPAWPQITTFGNHIWGVTFSLFFFFFFFSFLNIISKGRLPFMESYRYPHGICLRKLPTALTINIINGTSISVYFVVKIKTWSHLRLYLEKENLLVPTDTKRFGERSGWTTWILLTSRGCFVSFCKLDSHTEVPSLTSEKKVIATPFPNHAEPTSLFKFTFQFSWWWWMRSGSPNFWLEFTVFCVLCCAEMTV